MEQKVSFELGFYGGDTANSEIDLYDVAQALLGFQRSLALTTHLILNNEIITQAPSLKGASIYASLPEHGSWKLPATVVLASSMLYTVGTAPSNTALGHLVFSAYDYVVKESLGFHVDFEDSLGESYEKLRNENTNLPSLKEYRFDSLIEKCESSMRELHRPISGRGTAEKGRIIAGATATDMVPLGRDLTQETYEYVHQSVREPTVKQYLGRISSYNSNTFNGRIFLPSVGFTVPFQLIGTSRAPEKTLLVANSLMSNTQMIEPGEPAGMIYVKAESIVSKTKRLKRLEIVDLSRNRFPGSLIGG